MSVLDRLEALLAQATPGPWCGPSGTDKSVSASADLPEGATSRTIAMTGQTRGTLGWEESMQRAADDAALIAAAVNALPALIACARALVAWRSWNGGPTKSGGWPQLQEQVDQALARLAEGEPQP